MYKRQVSRFIVEIFRDVPRLIGPLSVTQLASILLVFGAFASIYVLSSEPVERQSAAGQQ